MSAPPALEHFARRAGRLYSLPAVAAEVLRLTDHPQVDTAALKDCIEKDPALTAKLLRVVNSSLFGLSGQVGDLGQAIALLGIRPLKLLVLGFSLPERMFAALAGEALARYWRRSLTRALAAREIGRRYFHTSGDEAFLAGLLTDLGMLVLLGELGEPYVNFLSRVEEEKSDLYRLELESLGFEHTQLSARLLGKWGLPDSICAALAATRDAAELRKSIDEDGALSQVLHLADLLAWIVADERTQLLSELLAAGRAYRGIERDELTELASQLGHQVAQLAELLSVELSSGPGYAEVVASAHRRLAELAEETILADESAEERLHAETLALSEAAARCARGGITPPHLPLPSTAARDDDAREFEGEQIRSIRPAEDYAAFAHSKAASTATAQQDVDPGLLGRLSSAVEECRNLREELSLLMIEVDDFAGQIIARGRSQAERLVRILQIISQKLNDGRTTVVPQRDAALAILLPGCDRQQVVRIGGELVRRFPRVIGQQLPASPIPVSISCGAATVAVPTRNFPPQSLLEAAERCLYGAQSCGGGTVKSIEIY